MKSRPRMLFLYAISALLVLCLGIAAGLAIYNRTLPGASEVVDQLTARQKAQLAEAVHLRQTYGDVVWPGWGKMDIPVITYNEAYAFLVGYPEPADGWVMPVSHQKVGTAWEDVPGDTFNGQVYYRQPLLDSENTPQNFIAQVGERWVATLETQDFMEVSFYQGFRESLPPLLREIFPYTLLWQQLMGTTEVYIGGLAHEAFHVFQSTYAGERLEQAEIANRQDERYPWDDGIQADAWKVELNLLANAVRTEDDAQAEDLTRQFLAARDQRRRTHMLAPALVDYERQREWLEGLAKYAELALLAQVQDHPEYTFVQTLDGDPNFSGYKKIDSYLSGQIDEIPRRASSEGESRFYYSGMAQARLLDRLSPGWKENALQPGVWLEDLLRQALNR